MEDIKSLYLAAKSSGNAKDIAAYKEAVQELLESNPNCYMSNLEYIISSSIGVNTWRSFIEKYGLPIACYDDVVNIFESCFEKAEAAQQDTSVYEKALEDLEEFREKYSNCFLMYDQIDVFEEKSKGALKFDFRLVINLKDAHPLQLIYELKNAKIHKVGKLDEKENMDEVDYVQKNIRKMGSTNHSSSGQKLLKIKDIITGKYLEEADVIGGFQKGIDLKFPVQFYGSDIADEDSFNKAKKWIDKQSADWKKDHIQHIKAGEIEVVPSYKSTFWTSKIIKNMKLRGGVSLKYYDIREIMDREGMGTGGRGIKVKKFGESTEEYDANINEKKECYIEMYYSFNSDGVQNKKLLSGMIQEFGEMAIPDLLITADQIGEKAITQALSYIESCYEIQSPLLFQHIVESVKDLTSVGSDNAAVNHFNEYANDKTLDSIINRMKARNTRIVQESVLMGNAEDAEIYYTEEEIEALNDLITFKEYMMGYADDPSMAVKLYNEICSLYEEFDGLIDEIDTPYTEEGDSEIAAIEESPAIVNTRNKKTGEAPNYISRNHDLDDDFLSSKNKHNNEDPDPNSLLRPSAKAADEDYEEPEEPEEDENKKSDHSSVNNYYYYTYNNSLNKNSNSFNKDSSTHDRHDIHDDHSTHSRRSTDDHSTGKRIHSDGDNNMVPANEGAKPWELDLFPKNDLYTEGLKSMLSNIGKKLTCIFRKKSLGNLQMMDSPRELRKMNTSIVPGIQISPKPVVKTESSDYDPSITLDQLIESGYDFVYDGEYISESTNLSENDIKEVVRELRKKYKTEIVFLSKDVGNVMMIQGPAFVLETDRESINNITKKKNSVVDDLNIKQRIKGDEGEFNRFIVINLQAIQSEFSITSKETLITLINHEYGHVKTYDQLTDHDWNDYFVRKSILSGCVVAVDPGAINFHSKASSTLNYFYYQLKPEMLANKYAGIDPTHLCYIMTGYKPNKSIKGLNIEKLLSVRIPDNVMQPAINALRGTPLTSDATLTYMKDTLKFYESENLFSDSKYLEPIRNSIEYMSGSKDIFESLNIEDPVIEYVFESSNYYMDADTYDRHIKQMWFIKSDDNVENCCISVTGYAKPMRGRSSMIALKKEKDEWYALIKKKPDGQWEFPGGGWDKNEKPIDAAIRELHEEAQVNVKNVKRLGTQIQYNSSKVAVSPWVKKHVDNSDDWWYGYYSAIFIGEEDGKFTGHIEEEDYEDTFTWKPLTFIAKKVSHKLMDSIEKHIQSEFKESAEYISEAVNVRHKKFDRAYKAAFNYENGHMIKITYSLQGCEVTNVGLSKAMIDHVGSVAEDVNKENHRGHKKTKNIRAFMVMLKGIIGANKFVRNRKKMITDFLNEHIGEIGYLDFQAKNCKIIGLYDLYTMEEIKDTIPIVGVYSARHMDSGKSKILSDKDLAAVHKLLESKKTKFHVADHKIGDVEIYPTFMSTYWNDKDDHNIVDLSNKVIDSDERDRAEDAMLNNIPDIIGDLEAKGFHVSDEEVEAFLSKYRDKDKWIPGTLSNEVKNAKRKKKKNSLVTEAVGDADDMKPESDHPIKDTLMDIDREMTKGQQKVKKKVQDVQNVGRAIAKPVVRTKQWIGNMVQNWKDMDETKIKEKMADPHARNNLFSAIGFAIKTGALAKAGLLFNPIFLFLSITRGVGKNKREYRIRNEMIGELKAELAVIDEKIEDARRNDDTKAKYKLMRLRNEINKKLLRVGGSKGWKKII